MKFCENNVKLEYILMKGLLFGYSGHYGERNDLNGKASKG